ncbi:MAG: ABC transporter substrate-binding protein [Candidatus Promineifilaceae bacterium]|nr:ABC transporter substrate-binding protein [Candidatus Promineifilaceae bacterium]
MKRRALFTTVALLLVAGWAAACGTEPSTWDRIANSGVLRVGLDPTYPPFETAEGGPLRGFDVDLMQSIGNHLDLDIAFVYFGYDGLYDALATGQVDVLASALVIAPERTRDFAYTQSYFDAGERLVSRAANPVTSPDEVAPGPLAVELGATGHVVATGWERQFPGLEVEPYETAKLAMDAVASGAARVALVDGVTALLGAAGVKDYYIGPQPITEEPYALVVRSEDRELLAQLDEALAHLDATQQLDLLRGRWLAP